MKTISKKITCVALSAVVSGSVVLSSEASLKADAARPSAQKIVERADELYGMTWVAKKTFKGFLTDNGHQYMFKKGHIYHLPYGQPIGGQYIGYGVSPKNFMKAAKNPNSTFYRYRNNRSPFMSTDCSAFVSYCWGIRRNTTYTLPFISRTIGKVNRENLEKIQVGDALNIRTSHVKLVTNVEIIDGKTKTIELTEQTCPDMKRTVYRRKDFIKANREYTILRYADTLPEEG